jgi:hypothetical protein
MPRYDDYDQYDDDDDYDDIRVGRRRLPARADMGPKPQSGVGITSVCLAAVAFVGYVITFGVAVVYEANNNNNVPRGNEDPVEMLLGLGLIGSGCLNLAGVVLGFVGCFQSDRGIIWSILGAVFNTILVFGVIALVCAGLAMAG